MKDIYLNAFHYVHNHSYTFFTNNFSGSLLKKINKLTRSFESFTDIAMFNFTYLIVSSIITIAIVASNSPLLAGLFV